MPLSTGSKNKMKKWKQGEGLTYIDEATGQPVFISNRKLKNMYQEMPPTASSLIKNLMVHAGYVVPKKPENENEITGETLI